jgi:hypothetical protein
MRRVKNIIWPTGSELTTIWRILQVAIPLDEPLRGEWRFSDAGAPNYRITGSTREVTWTVDVYNGFYFCVKVGNLPADVCEQIRPMVNLVCRMLRVPPRKRDHEEEGIGSAAESSGGHPEFG